MTGEQLGIFDLPIDTRRAAHEEAKSRAAKLKERILRELVGKELTADELAGRLGETAFSVRPRVCDLKKARRIVDTGMRRRNGSGKPAAVWRVK